MAMPSENVSFGHMKTVQADQGLDCLLKESFDTIDIVPDKGLFSTKYH